MCPWRLALPPATRHPQSAAIHDNWARRIVSPNFGRIVIDGCGTLRWSGPRVRSKRWAMAASISIVSISANC